MAKRIADTQLTKDHSSDGDNSWGAGMNMGPQKATPRQMAERKLAKPRGSSVRRSTLRPPGSSNPQYQQQQQSMPSFIQPNLAPQQQQSSLAFGQQPSSTQTQTSASFPPFGQQSSNNGFNTSFNVPSPSFSFSAAPAGNNPFTAPLNNDNEQSPAISGFHGSIFNYDSSMSKAERERKGDEVPQFAPGAPDFPSQPSASGQSQMQAQNNPFGLPTTHQQNTQNKSDMFSQTPTQSNIFGQTNESTKKAENTKDMFSGIYSPQIQSSTDISRKPTSDVFAHIQEPQAKTLVNPFASSIASFQQSQQGQSKPNIFGNAGPQSDQPLNNIFGQVSQPPKHPQPISSLPVTSESDSLMQTSPDNSPEARSKTQGGPFSFLNQISSQPQPHSSPTKQINAASASNSLFDRSSAPSADPNNHPPVDWVSSAKAAEHGGDLFNRVSGPVPNTNHQNPQSPTKSNINQGLDISNVATASQPPFNPFLKTTSSQASDAASEAADSPLKQRKIAQPTMFKAADEDKLPRDNPFMSLKIPPPSSSTFSSPFPSISSHKEQPQLAETVSQNVPCTDQDKANDVGKSNIAQNTNRQLGMPPIAPADFTDAEKAQLVTGFRLKALDVGVQRQVRSGAAGPDLESLKRFYEGRRQAILAAGDQPLQKATSGKRKGSSDEPDDSLQSSKKIKSGGSSETASQLVPNGQPSSSFNLSNSSQQPSSKRAKRKADEDLDEDSPQESNGKKARGEEPQLYPSLTSETSSSETSSMFKNILNQGKGMTESNKPAATANNMFSGKPLETPPIASLNAFQPKPTRSNGIFSPVANSNAPMHSLFQPNQTSASIGTLGSSEQSSSLPSSKSNQNASFSSTTVSSFQPSLSTEKASNPFAAKLDTAAPSVSAKNATFNMPKFGTNAPVNFLSQFGEKAKKDEEEEKKKRKADDFDSDEEDEAAWERRDAEAQRLKKQKIQEAAKTGPKFVLPKDEPIRGQLQPTAGGSKQSASSRPNESVFDKAPPSSTMTNGHNIFGHLSDVGSGAEDSKAGDADDEDDEEDAEDADKDDLQDKIPTKGYQVAEKEGQGPSPLNSIPSSSTEEHPFISSSTSFSRATQSTGRSLFDRVSKDETSTPKTPNISFKHVTSTISPSASKFASQSPFAGFKAVNEKPSNEAANAETRPQRDHTWKKDSPISFGNSSLPALNVTSPSPSKAPLSGLFGSSKANTSSNTPSKPTPSILSSTPTPAPNPSVGFEIKPLMPAASSLAPPGPASNNTSRATSPGITTGESANESTGDAADDAADREAGGADGSDQFDLTSAGLLEDEVCLFDVKPSKIWLRDPSTKEDKLQGRGRLRVLKGKAPDGLARVLVLSDPSGNEILNTNLIKLGGYPIVGGLLRIVAQQENGQMQNWGVKIAKDTPLSSLKQILDENKIYGI